MKLLSLYEFKSGLEYHDELNPVLWKDDALLPEVKAKLDTIALHFSLYLKIDPAKISDIVITGSNCNYNYSPLSDIDLHIVAEFDPDAKNELGESVQDQLNAFKDLYNVSHHIKVHDVPIEVYVQPSTETFTSNAGVFSLKRNQWLQHPVKVHVDLDNREIATKAKPVIHEINSIVNGKVKDPARIKALKAKIRQLRNAGLQAGGEFGVENLAFKAIRNDGYLDKLSRFSDALTDDDLSLTL